MTFEHQTPLTLKFVMAGVTSQSNAPAPIFRSGTNAETSVQELRVFVGPYVHSLSWEDPLVIQSNGVIGVKDGKVFI